MGAEPSLTTTDVAVLHDFYKSYFNSLQTASEGIEPILKGMARWQLEAFGLMSRRARAYAELPAKITQCRAPQDFANVSLAFWQTAIEQYCECTNRGLEACAPMWTQQPAAGNAQARREHEYILLPEADKISSDVSTSVPVRASAGQKRRVA